MKKSIIAGIVGAIIMLLSYKSGFILSLFCGISSVLITLLIMEKKNV